jgi:hypothetical protein
MVKVDKGKKNPSFVATNNLNQDSPCLTKRETLQCSCGHAN